MSDTTAAAPAKRRGHFNKRKTRQAIAGFLFIAPALLGFIIFMFVPTAAAFVLSLFQWDVVTPPVFIGTENYATAFSDPLFWNAIKVTLQYMVYHIPASLILAFIMALAMKQKIKGVGLFRTAFIVPWITTPVVTLPRWCPNGTKRVPRCRKTLTWCS